MDTANVAIIVLSVLVGAFATASIRGYLRIVDAEADLEVMREERTHARLAQVEATDLLTESRHQVAIAKRERDEAVAAAEDLQRRIDASLDGLLTRRRVAVSAVDNATGWQGLVVDVLADALVLEACTELAKDAAGEVRGEAMPGLVVIPRNRILAVQVVTD